MKKVLFGTSALFGIAGLAASAAAHSNAPTVTLGGFGDFRGAYIDEDAAGTDANDFKFASEAEIHLNVDGKSDTGLEYGAGIELNANAGADKDGDGTGGEADKTFLYLQGGWGRVEMGATAGPSETMKVSAQNIAAATGGIDNTWGGFLETGTATALAAPDLPIQGADAAGADANKVIYYSPRVYGLQFGAAYTPDADVIGPVTAGTAAGTAEDVFTVGLNYEQEYDGGFGVQLGAVGEFGKAKTAGTEDLAAWAVGAILSYGGFSLAGEYGDHDDSLAAPGTETTFWDVGAAFENGPYRVSVGYLQTETGSTDFDLLSVGADYQLAEGFTPYAEINFFDSSDFNSNEGTVFILGSQFGF